MSRRGDSTLARVRVAIVVAIFAGAVIAGWAFTQSMRSSKALLVHTVNIEGIDHLERDDVLALAGLDVPRNALNIDRKELETRLLLSPWIDAVEVERPGRGIIDLTIHEAQPRVVVAAPHLVVADAEGKVIGAASPRYNDLPLVTGAARHVPSDAQREALDPETLALTRGLGGALTREFEEGIIDGGVVRDAVRLTDLWAAADRQRRWQVVELGWVPADGFAMVLDGDIEVRVGNRDHAERVARAYAALAATPEASIAELRRIDARPDRRAVLRFDAPAVRHAP